MNIEPGHMGLSIGFLVVCSVLLWFLIHTRGRALIKIILTFLTIWYGLVIYYSVQSLAGWPTLERVPDNSRLLAVRINEPDPGQNNAGAIYLWVSTDPGEDDHDASPGSFLNPLRMLSYADQGEPRSYKMNYSRDMHKAIVDAQQQSKRVPGAQMRIKNKNGKTKQGRGAPGGIESAAALEFEIVNPVHLLPKAQQWLKSTSRGE